MNIKNLNFEESQKIAKSSLKNIIGGKHIGGCSTGAGSYQNGNCTVSYSADSYHQYDDPTQNWTQYHLNSNVYPGADISCYSEACSTK